MKLALLSDIHANIQAFDARLSHAYAQGARQFALLGDLVGYGANPLEVLDRVQTLAAGDALIIKGNHDQMAVTPPVEVAYVGSSTGAWTHAQRSPDQHDFLDHLPLTLQQGAVLLVHASVNDPERWRYVTDERSV